MALLCGAMLCTACEKDDPKSTACDIASFTVNDKAWDIDDTNITRAYPEEEVAASLTPTITLSPGAMVNPSSGTAQNFFTEQGVTYTVTAEDGVTTKTYTVKATLRSVDSGNYTWTLTGAPGNYTLTISGSGAMGSYDNEDVPWYSYRDGIKTAIIQDGITVIGGNAFSRCSNLTAMTIPNSVTAISYGAFSGCTGLTGMIIPNSVKTIGVAAFSGCTGLTSVTIGNSVQTIGYDAFGACTGLTSVTIPNSVTMIDRWAFVDCTGLTSVTIGASVQTISGNAFAGCIGLTSVTIPNSVQTIDNWAFGDCAGLTSVTIGASVQTIGYSAFFNCSNLTTVVNLNPTPQNIADAVFYNANLNAATLKVPASAVDAYKAAPVWSEFGKIEAISENDG
jgi:hypothetical protein